MFCEKYSRKTEFRKLCDNLRTHLSHIQKQQGSATAVNLNNPETQQVMKWCTLPFFFWQLLSLYEEKDSIWSILKAFSE